MQFVSADELAKRFEGEEGDGDKTMLGLHRLKFAWAAVFAWIAFGGAVLSVLEYSGEADRIQSYCALKRELDNDGESGITNVIGSFGSAGFCTIPSCNYVANVTNATLTNNSSWTPFADRATANEDLNWTFLGSCFFCLTAMTTIGYGNYVPVTGAGKTFTVLFTVIGMIIYAFANFLMACTVEQQLNQLHKKFLKSQDERTGTRKACSTHVSKAALILAELAAVCAWMLCMAAAYSSAEGWSFFDAFYFSFVTLNTIGYGDFAPRKTRDSLWNYFFIFGGLFLNSVVLSTIIRSQAAVVERGKGAISKDTKVGGGAAQKKEDKKKDEKDAKPTRRAKAGTMACMRCFTGFLSWLRNHARLISLMSALVAYTVIGGGIFRALEADNAKLSMDTFSQTMEQVTEGTMRKELEGELLMGSDNGDPTAIAKTLVMDELVTRLRDSTNCPGAQPEEAGVENVSPWTFVASCMFAAATYTSVGYGDIAPKTTGGKIMVMLYFFPGAWLLSMVSLEISKGLHKRIMKRVMQRGGLFKALLGRFRHKNVVVATALGESIPSQQVPPRIPPR
jgi:hypothetical protein